MTTPAHARLADLLSKSPVILAPMEDVSDAIFRQICRDYGAEICVTEFVNAEGLLRGCRKAKRKLTLAKGDDPTAIQIYGADPERLREAAVVAEAANPAFLDINCGCWVPKVSGRGAGAGWLRKPSSMVEMAKLIVSTVSLPVTVKTRIGWGPESEMPIVDLARRLEDAGVSAITIHCRVATAGHSGPADWSWARKAREVVKIPVIVNGDVKTAADAKRALDETGCAGVMVARAAIDHPWIFREARALIERGEVLAPPTPTERFELYKKHLGANVEVRGPEHGVQVSRRHIGGYLRGLPGVDALRKRLIVEPTVEGCIRIVDDYAAGRYAPASGIKIGYETSTGTLSGAGAADSSSIDGRDFAS